MKEEEGEITFKKDYLTVYPGRLIRINFSAKTAYRQWD